MTDYFDESTFKTVDFPEARGDNTDNHYYLIFPSSNDTSSSSISGFILFQI